MMRKKCVEADVVTELIRNALMIGASVATISGETKEGWGYRIQVLDPKTWKRVQRREEDLGDDSDDE